MPRSPSRQIGEAPIRMAMARLSSPCNATLCMGRSCDFGGTLCLTLGHAGGCALLCEHLTPWAPWWAAWWTSGTNRAAYTPGGLCCCWQLRRGHRQGPWRLVRTAEEPSSGRLSGPPLRLSCPAHPFRSDPRPPGSRCPTTAGDRRLRGRPSDNDSFSGAGAGSHSRQLGSLQIRTRTPVGTRLARDANPMADQGLGDAAPASGLTGR